MPDVKSFKFSSSPVDRPIEALLHMEESGGWTGGVGVAVWGAKGMNGSGATSTSNFWGNALFQELVVMA